AAHSGENFVAISYHDVRHDVVRDYDPDQFAVSTQNLAAHFAWLDHHGYTAISVDDLIAAARNERPLPDKAVLLTFDDTYTDVYPLLKIFKYPAVVSVVTDWLDMSPDQTVEYGKRQLGHDDFISWDEAREMQDSGLVEIASHSANLHHGIVANPQGNLIPAAITRAYNGGRYESYKDFRARIAADIARSTKSIDAALGSSPRVMTWPYGKYTQTNLELADKLGMPISLTLEVGTNTLANLSKIRRILILGNPGIEEFSAELILPRKQPLVRAAQVDLDYVYDEDPLQQKSNLDALLDRIKELQISHVFLQAFADPDGDGAADALYFPNRHLPVRADLFSRVAWQLMTRSDVQVFAWIPMLAYRSKTFDPSWQVAEHSVADSKPDASAEPRLSPFHPEARRVIREIYQDMATYADFDGVLLHDDGRLNEFEDASGAAMQVYRREFGDDFEIPLAHEDPVLGKKWSRFKTQALIDFGNELIWVLRERKPELKTARNLFAPAALDDSSEAWLAQSLSLFLDSYDYVALMAMPYLENSDDPDRYLDRLSTAVAQHDVGLERTIFELQAVDWRTETAVPATILYEQMRRLQAGGVKHLAYYPDDFIASRPALERIREGISLAEYPFHYR
ncbi:MAG: poly-beta-1,6-N-acetyl-D-glucosamine N-deacetylase PgaB, partial [Woeseiaceae bacterium]